MWGLLNQWVFKNSVSPSNPFFWISLGIDIPPDNQAIIESSASSHQDDSAIPDEVTEEVERLLREQRKAEQNLPTTKREKVLTTNEEMDSINVTIWEFGGHRLHHSTHQVRNIGCNKMLEYRV